MQVKQRKVRNLLLKPLLQVKLGMYSILLSVSFAVVFVFVFITSFDRLFQFVLDLTDARQQVLVEINSQFNVMLGWLLLVSATYLILIIVVSIVFTHKLVGPSIAFRRHIKALTNGRYSSRVTLRKGDAFAEVAEDLNELAETLGKNSQNR